MTHRITTNDPDSGVSEELHCTERELVQAGFQVGELDEVLGEDRELDAEPEGLFEHPKPLGELVELHDIDPRPRRSR